MSELLRNKILELTAKREYPKTCCPSEVARALNKEELQQLECQDWRAAMEPIRQEAYEMCRLGMLEVTQKGDKVELDQLGRTTGPLRIRQPPQMRDQENHIA